MRIVCISDTHGRHEDLDVPGGDVLVHAGDFTMLGEPGEVEAFGGFLAGLPHRHKVVVAGNHDFLFQSDLEEARARLGKVSYVQDGGVEVEGLSVWGSPWQPWFGDWAFTRERGAPLAEKWALVPEGVDVLVTHGPPKGVLDVTSLGESVGCEELARERGRIRPRLHVFGHIHESFGVHRADGILSVNASSCDGRYRATRRPVVVDWDADGPRVVELP